MTTTLEATYEDGKLILDKPLPLPNKAHVIVTVETGPITSDGERASWLELSEHSLLKAWDNPQDDVFNNLLAK
ncbi:MAG: antitoxin family protein [Verrucomicrobia bacterium]|nr:antitoxin family protein [Verrucomicrobiota bacterium]